MRRAVIYLRVSTLEQTTANQERELREIAGRMGCEIVKVYKDHGISGTRGRDKRRAFDRLSRDAALREFDLVMAWSVDRLGRSLQDLVGFLSELHALKIDLFLRQQGLDTTTPAGKAMFQMLGVFAEFERTMIAERVRAGLARARSEGKRLGRPQLPPHSKNESVRPWRLLGDPVCASLPSGSESILAQCSGSATLSSLQTSSPPYPSQRKAAALTLDNATSA
jgi:DNA invertase Pin-like site-specific DNA recombinase